MSEKDPIALLERAVRATEREPTAEEIAAWEAEKADAVAAREKHAAHMDRAEKRSLEQMAVAERQAAALERIAAAIEALTGVRWPPAQPMPWGGSVPELNNLNLGDKP